MYISKFSFLVCPLNILSWQAGESRAAQGSALVIRDQKPRENPYRALQYSTVQYSTVQYSTVHDNDIAEPHRAGLAQSGCRTPGPRPGPCSPPAPAGRPGDLSVSIPWLAATLLLAIF